MASSSDKRQMRSAPGDHHDDARKAPPPAKRMKEFGSSSAATAITTTTPTNSFSVFSAAATFPPVTATVFGSKVVGNDILGYPLDLHNERLVEMAQTRHHGSGNGINGSGINNNITYWSSPLTKTASPPSGASHYYEA